MFKSPVFVVVRAVFIYRSPILVVVLAGIVFRSPISYAVWERLHPECQGRMFGIGSSDPRFVVTGSYSYGVTRQSQEVKDVRSQLEQEREARKSLEDRLEQMEKESENERAVREKLQKQMEQIMKKFA